MADEVDITTERQEIEMEAFRKNLSMRGRELEPKGSCHFCEEVVCQPKLFCDINCAQDWEKRRGH